MIQYDRSRRYILTSDQEIYGRSTDMKDYLLLLLSDILLALNFAATKGYQKREGASGQDGGISLQKGLIFNVILGLISAFMFWAMNGFRLAFSLFSMGMAFAQAALVVGYTIIGFRIMAEGKMSIYTVFLMAGGMSVPYVWGLLFLDEPFSWLRMIGLLVIIAAVVITNAGGGKVNGRLILLLCSIFFLNGFVSVISKEHQIHPTAIGTVDFCVWSNVAKAVVSLTVWPLTMIRSGKRTAEAPASGTGEGVWEQAPRRQRVVTVLLVVIAAATSGISFLFQLMGAENLPASVLFPIVTGGSIICTAIAGRVFFKEKLTKPIILGLILCLLGTCLFLDLPIG